MTQKKIVDNKESLTSRIVRLSSRDNNCALLNLSQLPKVRYVNSFSTLKQLLPFIMSSGEIAWVP